MSLFFFDDVVIRMRPWTFMDPRPIRVDFEDGCFEMDKGRISEVFDNVAFPMDC